MRADAALRFCMLGLVLVNLVFVFLTGVAGPRWLAPLVLLTVLSPWLGKLRDRLIYRALWNLGVLAFFAVLLWHATGDDLRFVLQDGFVLAALCQVHLLNNLRADQRPDLLFLNSFLIAIVTGYLCLDLAFPIAFLVYVPLFVIGLQLLCVSRRGQSLGPADTLRVVRDGMGRSAVLLLSTMLVFLFWPRNFQREGFLASEFEFDFSSDSDTHEIAFNENVTLDRKGRSTASDRIVMKVSVLRGQPSQVPALWRGATLGATNGREWWPFNRRDLAASALDGVYWDFTGSSLVCSGPLDSSGPKFRVENVDPEANRLFAPLGAQRIDLRGVTNPRWVTATPDGALRYGEPSAARPALKYDLWLAAELGTPSNAQVPEEPDARVARFSALPRSQSLAKARELADQLAGRLPANSSQHDLVEHFSQYLTRFEYLPPGADGAASDLDSFLAGSAGAHCEFFASALATMLRCRSVPCRLVTGYRSTEWDAEGQVLTFRRRHAHAWVEVFDPESGWYAVDPTPPTLESAGPSLWERLQASLGAAWSQLAEFNAERRGEVFAWARAQPGHIWRGLRSHPGPTSLGLVALGACAALIGRLRRRDPPSVHRYRLTLRHCGLQLGSGETPRDLLERAQTQGLSQGQLQTLAASTHAHEHSRYAA